MYIHLMLNRKWSKYSCSVHA